MQSIIVEILLSVLAVMIGVGSFVGASRANKLQSESAQTAIDATAYQRAREIYESAIDTLQEHVTGLREQMITLDSEVAKLQETNRSLMLQVSELQATNRDLTIQVAGLQRSNTELLVELRSHQDNNNAQ
jgi:cell division protein FtsB